MSTVIDYIANNVFGSFSSTIVYAILFVICVVVFVVAGHLGDYLQDRPNTPKYAWVLMLILAVVAFLLGFLAFITICASYDNATAYKVAVKPIGSVQTINTAVSDLNDRKDTTVMTLAKQENPVTLDVYELPLDKPHDNRTIVEVNFKNDKAETYYAPAIKETYTSNLAKKLNADPDTQQFVTQTVTHLDEQKIEVIVTANKLKRTKTIKTATIAVTYSVDEKGKKAYKDYLNDPKTLTARRAKLRQDLQDAVDNDALWE